MLQYYFAPGSSSMAPHIALHEVGADFEAHPLSFAAREHKAPAYLAINPQGRVPTLVIDGRPMTEVAGILFYLAQRFPDAGLLPHGDVEETARVVSWMSFIASVIHPAWQRGPEFAEQAMAFAEQRLDEREWTVGGRISIADIHLFRLFWRFKRSHREPASRFRGLMKHYDRMMERESVIETISIESALGYELPR